MKQGGHGPIAVTGAAGRVGGCVLASLAALGVPTIAVDRFEQQQPGPERWYRDSLDDVRRIARHFAGCSAVIHLAGAVPAARRQVSEYRIANVWTTAVVAEAAAQASVGLLVLASTSHVYGQHVPQAITESAPLSPVSAYALSKAAAEELADAWTRVGGPTTIAARLGTLYGFLPADETVIGRLIGQALRQEPLRVRSTSDVRDFTHVADAAEALARLSLLSPSVDSMPVNVSSGVGVAVSELIQIVQSVSGQTREPVVVDDPYAAGSTLVMNVERLRRLIGGIPSRGIDSGIREMLHEPLTGGRKE